MLKVIWVIIRKKIFPNGILFLQETHSTKENEIKWKDKFNGNLYFVHGKSNSRGVLIGFSGKKTFTKINFKRVLLNIAL